MSKQQQEVGLIWECRPPPSSSTTTTAVRTQNEHSITQKNIQYDKEDRSYARETEKVSYSSGSFGRGGYKEEYKVTDTYKVGNPEGYREHTIEERVRDVTYGNNNTITYDDDCHGCDPAYDDDCHGCDLAYDDGCHGSDPAYDDGCHGSDPAYDDGCHGSDPAYDDGCHGSDPAYDDCCHGSDPAYDDGCHGCDPDYDDASYGYYHDSAYDDACYGYYHDSD